MAGTPDVKLLAQQDKTYFSEPDAVLARGVKIKVRDFQLSDNQQFVPPKLTNYEVGVQAEKNIVVPSFGTTSVIFTRHFQTLC